MRAFLRDVILDTHGNAIANAAVNVYRAGTTTAPAMYSSATGAAIANPLISNSRGEIEAWLAVGQTVDFEVTDNAGRAYAAGNSSARLSWDTFTKQLAVAGWQPPEGLWVPAGWGANWLAAREAAADRLVNIVGWGDSIMVGYYASDWRLTSFFGALVDALQDEHGDGGSGFLSVASSQAWGAPAGARFITSTGSWTGALFKGVNEAAIQNAVNGNGASVTFPGVRGTSIDCYFLSDTGTCTVAIDGGAPSTVDLTAHGSGLVKITFGGLANVAHTVVITNATLKVTVCGVAGTNTVGVVGHNMSSPGRPSTAGAVTTGLAAGTSGSVSITDFAPDLMLLAMSVNDVALATAVDAFRSNLYRLARLARDYSSGKADLALIVNHYGKGAGTSDPSNLYAGYAEVIHGLGETFGAAVLDVWALGRNSWDHWHDLGYWGVTNGSTGAAGTDAVHPSDAGHGAIAAPLIELLTA
jgi:lysophospholipase L1-like esterase